MPKFTHWNRDISLKTKSKSQEDGGLATKRCVKGKDVVDGGSREEHVRSV